jgi:PAS domain S-box-containing protein
MSLKIFQWLSIQARVTLYTVGIFLISIWSLTFYSTWMLHDDFERLMGEQEFSTVSLIAADINQELAERLRSLQKVAGTVSPSMLDNTAAVQELMEHNQILQRQFNGGTFTTRLDGTAIASIPLSIERIGDNYMNSDSIAAALKEGKSTIGRPDVGKNLLAPVLVMAVPIRDKHGKVIGALAGVTNLDSPNFLDRFTENRYGKTGGYLLIAPQHKLFVSATDRSRVMQPIPASGINPMHDRFMQGFDGFGISKNSHGIEELSAAKHIPVADWFVVAVLPTEEAFAPIHAMQQRRLVAMIFLTLLVGGLTWWITWWMLRRQLSPMLAATRALTAQSDTNHPPQPLTVTNQDEIGELIGGFNRLLETLAQRELALRDSVNQFRTLTTLAPIGICLSDTKGNCLYANARWCEMAGMGMQEALGEGWLKALHPEDRDSVFANWQQMVESEGEWGFEHRLLTPDNKVTWVYGLAAAQRDDSGEIVKYVVINLDITERKQMEEAREEALSRLQKIASQVPGIVFQFRLCTDGSSSVPYASEALREIYRLSPDDVRDDAAPIFSAVHPDDLAEHLASIEASARTLTPWHQEYRLRFAGEPDIWLLGNAIPQQEADGSVLAHGFITDITKRKQAEEQFRIAAAAFESQQAMAVTDSDGVILQVNRAFTEITVYPAEEIVGHTPQKLLSRRHNVDFYHAMWETLRRRGGWRGEVWAQRKNGEVYPKWLTISEVKDDDGVVTHYIWAHTDITERKKAKARSDARTFYDDYR